MVADKSSSTKNGPLCLPDSSCYGCELKRSTTTRLSYTVFLLVATILCFIVLAPKTKKKLFSTPHLCSELLDPHLCANLVGYSAVYRICFAVASFFLVLSVLFVQVKFVDELRARIHNGYWYFKFMGFVGEWIFATHQVWQHNAIAGLPDHPGIISSKLNELLGITCESRFSKMFGATSLQYLLLFPL